MTRRRRVPSPHRFDEAAIAGVADDLEAFVEELAAEDRARDVSDVDELAHALNVAIDGLQFLQHVLESHAQNDRGRHPVAPDRHATVTPQEDLGARREAAAPKSGVRRARGPRHVS